jgi:hypothetical protein
MSVLLNIELLKALGYSNTLTLWVLGGKWYGYGVMVLVKLS